MADRYKIVDESQSVHCCFRKTVVDTTRPVMIHGEHHDDKYEAMCECIDEDAAPVICDALNAVDRFRWIPVSERLPEQDAWCVIAIRAPDRYSGQRPASPGIEADLGKWQGNCWKTLSGPGKTILHPSMVTHWMPLPEPPEAK